MPKLKHTKKITVDLRGYKVFFRDEGKNHQEATFREWFDHKGSLYLKFPYLALTATTCSNHRGKIMTKLCFGNNACVISYTADKKALK